MWFNYLILTFLYLSTRLPFARFYPVYYDSFEYVRIGQNINWQNFIPLINFSHQPIHTLYFLTILVFKSLFSFIKPETLLTSISLLFGLMTLFIWFKLLSEFFDKKNPFFATLLVLVFPYFFVVNTNILYESELLFFQIASLYLLLKASKKNSGSLLITSGLHYGASLSVFIGSILLLPIYLAAILKKGKNQILKFLIFFLIPFAFLTSLDLLIFKSPQIIINKFTSHAFDLVNANNNLPLLIGRLIRNILVQYGAILSVSGLVPLLFALTKMFNKDRKRFVLYLISFFPAIILMQYWHAGLFGRLSIYIIFPASLLLAETFQTRWLRILIIFLISLTTLNYALHQRKISPLYQYYSLLEKSKNSQNFFVITSDYNRFLYEKNGKNIFIIKDREDNSVLAQKFIEDNLRKGLTVTIDSAGLRFPYYQYDGDFYHILSTGKVGSSLSLKFLENYQLKLLEADKDNPDINFFVLSPKKNNGKLTTFTNYPSASIISPNQSYSFDPTARLFYLIFDKKDPIFWYYDYQVIY